MGLLEGMLNSLHVCGLEGDVEWAYKEPGLHLQSVGVCTVPKFQNKYGYEPQLISTKYAEVRTAGRG